ncbi:MAG: nucleotide exchange factor GrpE [Candidatus Taylorbacteria bacterium]|nr:nucleotide exchange factor GrpE [Candidatus Taylorbacteria bacterium]
MNKDKEEKKDEIKENDNNQADISVDDVVYDSNVDSDNLFDPKEKIAKLKAKIKELESEKSEYMNGWQRERADFVNYKKRVENERVETIKFANENLIAELLAVIESFDMAFSNKEAWEKVDKTWRVGVEYIHTQFLKTLKENGLSEIDPVGQKFDPSIHVAEEMKEVQSEKEDGIILKVNKKGFNLNGRVIVAPNVVVGECTSLKSKA